MTAQKGCVLEPGMCNVLAGWRLQICVEVPWHTVFLSSTNIPNKQVVNDYLLR